MTLQVRVPVAQITPDHSFVLVRNVLMFIAVLMIRALILLETERAMARRRLVCGTIESAVYFVQYKQPDVIREDVANETMDNEAQLKPRSI